MLIVQSRFLLEQPGLDHIHWSVPRTRNPMHDGTTQSLLVVTHTGVSAQIMARAQGAGDSDRLRTDKHIAFVLDICLEFM